MSKGLLYVLGGENEETLVGKLGDHDFFGEQATCKQRNPPPEFTTTLAAAAATTTTTSSTTTTNNNSSRLHVWVQAIFAGTATPRVSVVAKSYVLVMGLTSEGFSDALAHSEFGRSITQQLERTSHGVYNQWRRRQSQSHNEHTSTTANVTTLSESAESSRSQLDA